MWPQLLELCASEGDKQTEEKEVEYIAIAEHIIGENGEVYQMK